nr:MULTISPECIES: TonB-dependent receptor [Bradyrhizobium]
MAAAEWNVTPLPDRAGTADETTIASRFQRVARATADTANTARVPGVVLGNLALHYEWDNNWRAALNVVNVTDKIYVASCATISSCYYGDRRRITASLAYKW